LCCLIFSLGNINTELRTLKLLSVRLLRFVLLNVRTQASRLKLLPPRDLCLA
jgi:hypothetical protein